MKHWLQLEELAEFVFSIFLFMQLPYAWWFYPLLLLIPDISLVAQIAGRPFGSLVYNVIHHKGLAIGLFVLGAALQIPPASLAGAILLGHASFDRMLGLGLMSGDTFTHAHLRIVGPRIRRTA
jgi:hypothetical protein